MNDDILDSDDIPKKKKSFAQKGFEKISVAVLLLIGFLLLDFFDKKGLLHPLLTTIPIIPLVLGMIHYMSLSIDNIFKSYLWQEKATVKRGLVLLIIILILITFVFILFTKTANIIDFLNE